MKTKLVTLFTLTLFLLVILLPNIVYAATSNYSFSMSGHGRVVNGKSNGVFYTISNGRRVTINGSTWITSSLQGALNPPQSIRYTLYRSISILPDKEYGTVNGGISRSFSGTLSSAVDTTSNSYYLFIWRTVEDGHAVSGTGSLSH